jgi:hypothetical protein
MDETSAKDSAMSGGVKEVLNMDFWEVMGREDEGKLCYLYTFASTVPDVKSAQSLSQLFFFSFLESS